MPGRRGPPTPAMLGAWASTAAASVPRRVAGAGVHHHARGLVDHEDVLVLEDDRERDRLGGHLLGRRRRELRRDPLAGAQAMRRLRGGAVHSHGAVVDQSANARPRHLGQPRREPLVEPRPALGPAHGGVEPLPTAAFTA